jgi:uncharacterized protein DUF4386
MDSIRATARQAGLLYFLAAILMIFGYMYVPTLFSGDAATTARKIAGNELLYRVCVLIAVASQILFLFAVLTLYKLFRGVDRQLARLMVALVCVGVAAEFVNIANRMSHLLLSSNADYLAAFTKAQRDALADGILVMGNNLGRFLTVFWGLWLFPFGIVTIKSGYVPRILGVLLMAAGAGYLLTCVTYIVFPDFLPVMTRIASPLYFGELPIILWLLVVGAREPDAEARPVPAT